MGVCFSADSIRYSMIYLQVMDLKSRAANGAFAILSLVKSFLQSFGKRPSTLQAMLFAVGQVAKSVGGYRPGAIGRFDMEGDQRNAHFSDVTGCSWGVLISVLGYILGGDVAMFEDMFDDNFCPFVL